MRLIEENHVDGTCVLALAGDIDLHYAPVFRSLLKPWADRCEALILDLSEVPFIDSSGIAVLIEQLRSCDQNSVRFCIGGMSTAVGQILSVVCLEKVMPLFETRAEALAACRSKAAEGHRG